MLITRVQLGPRNDETICHSRARWTELCGKRDVAAAVFTVWPGRCKISERNRGNERSAAAAVSWKIETIVWTEWGVEAHESISFALYNEKT